MMRSTVSVRKRESMSTLQMTRVNVIFISRIENERDISSVCSERFRNSMVGGTDIGTDNGCRERNS